MLHLVGIQTNDYDQISENSDITRNTNSFEDPNQFFMRSSDNLDSFSEKKSSKELSLDVGFLQVSRSKYLNDPDQDLKNDLVPELRPMPRRRSRSLSPSKTTKTGASVSSATSSNEYAQATSNDMKGPYVRKIEEVDEHQYSKVPKLGALRLSFSFGKPHERTDEEEAHIAQQDNTHEFFSMDGENMKRPKREEALTHNLSAEEKAQTSTIPKLFSFKRDSSSTREHHLLQSQNSENQIRSNDRKMDYYGETDLMEQGKQFAPKEHRLSHESNTGLSVDFPQNRNVEDDIFVDKKPSMIHYRSFSKSSVYSNVSSINNSIDGDKSEGNNGVRERHEKPLPSHLEHYDADIDDLERNDHRSRSGLSVDFPENRRRRSTSNAGENSSNDGFKQYSHGPIHDPSQDSVGNGASSIREDDRSTNKPMQRRSSLRSVFSKNSARNLFAPKLSRDQSRKSLVGRRKSSASNQSNQETESSKKSAEVFFGWGDDFTSSEEETFPNKGNANEEFSDDEDVICDFAHNATALRAKARREETIRMQMEEEYDSKRPWRKPPPTVSKDAEKKTKESKDMIPVEDLQSLSNNSKSSFVQKDHIEDVISVISEADSIEIAVNAIHRFEKFGVVIKRTSTSTLLEAYAEEDENESEEDSEHSDSAKSSSDEEEIDKEQQVIVVKDDSSVYTSDEDLLVGFGAAIRRAENRSSFASDSSSQRTVDYGPSPKSQQSHSSKNSKKHSDHSSFKDERTKSKKEMKTKVDAKNKLDDHINTGSVGKIEFHSDPNTKSHGSRGQPCDASLRHHPDESKGSSAKAEKIPLLNGSKEIGKSSGEEKLPLKNEFTSERMLETSGHSFLTGSVASMLDDTTISRDDNQRSEKSEILNAGKSEQTIGAEDENLSASKSKELTASFIKERKKLLISFLIFSLAVIGGLSYVLILLYEKNADLVKIINERNASLIADNINATDTAGMLNMTTEIATNDNNFTGTLQETLVKESFGQTIVNITSSAPPKNTTKNHILHNEEIWADDETKLSWNNTMEEKHSVNNTTKIDNDDGRNDTVQQVIEKTSETFVITNVNFTSMENNSLIKENHLISNATEPLRKRHHIVT